MAQDNHTTEVVRRNLAYFWSVIAAIFLFYAAVKWGANHPEIQTLLIGFVLGGGIMAAVMGAYFSYNPSKSSAPAAPAIENADTVNVNNTTDATDSSTSQTTP